MRKLIKWLLGLIVFLGLLMVLAIVLLPVFFDPNDHKPRIQQLASETIGRQVVLNGPIEWSVFPWLAINLNEVTVVNETGFKGASLAEMTDVSVRVKLLPLLKKEIKVGLIELKQPNINLQVAKSGKSNWQSLVDAIGSSSKTQTTESSSLDLEIRGVLISEGQLTYTDGSADLQIKLTDLNYSSEAIKSGQATPMSLAAQASITDMEISGEVSAKWQTLNLNSTPQLLFEDLSFQGYMHQIPLNLRTEGDVALDMAADSLNLSKLTLEYGDLTLTTPVLGKELSGQMNLAGTLDMPTFSLADLLMQMGSPLRNQADNELSGNMDWSLKNGRLLLDKMKLQLDDSNISGVVDIADLGRLQGRFDFTVDAINLDQYLPVAPNEEATSVGSTDTAAMDLGLMTGQIKMAELLVAGVKMDDITLNIKTQGKNIMVDPLQADFYQGLISTELLLQPEKSTGQLQITHSMRDFQAGGLLTDLMGTGYLTGLGQLNADIKVDEPFSENPLKTANGTISYRLSDGDIVGIDVYQIMQQSLSLLNKTDAVKVNEDLKTAFGLMDIQGHVVNGILKTETLRLTSPYFDLNGQVEVDLDQQTIRGTIKPMLTNIPEGVLDKRFSKLLNMRIPVKLRGNLLAPDISIDIEKLILESQKAKIDEKKEELKEDLFDAILGSKKDKKKTATDTKADSEASEKQEMTEKQKRRAEKDQLKRDLLEGLFNSAKDNDEKDKGDDNDNDSGDGN